MSGAPLHHPWLLDAVADPANGWSVGTFGAIAEFTRDPDEPVTIARSPHSVSVATNRGALRLGVNADLVPVAYETPSADGETWNHAVALCLPREAAAMSRRTTLTRLGPDTGTIREEDRGAVLFDMGLGCLSVDVCIRTRDPDLIAVLDGSVGRSLFESGNPAMGAIVAAGPHRLFVTKVGRAEVYQPIPPVDGRSPDGPHTHVLPKLLRSGRTHAATTPIPVGLVPCGHLFPPNPHKDALGQRRPFDRPAHAAFLALHDAFGAPDLVQLKRDGLAAMARGDDPDSFTVPDGKHARPTLRVAIRVARLQPSPAPVVGRWAEVFDRRQVGETDDEEQPAH